MKTSVNFVTFYLHTNIQNEDVDTSDSITSSSTNASNNNNAAGGGVGGAVATSAASSAVQSRQSSADGDTSSSASGDVGRSGAPTAAITTTDAVDGDLPPGWSLQVAPNGRIFFIDHNDRKTSWVDPRTGRASPMPNQGRKPEDDLGPLPEGWEERVHSDGRIFFIDHSNRNNF